MLRDPIFGDTRLDFGEPTLLDDRPPPPGPPSRQDVYIADEDIELRFLGYELQDSREWMWAIATFLSAGLLGLLGQWFPKMWLSWVAEERGFKLCSRGIIVVEVCQLPFPDVFATYLFFSLDTLWRHSHLQSQNRTVPVLLRIDFYGWFTPLIHRTVLCRQYTSTLYS